VLAAAVGVIALFRVRQSPLIFLGCGWFFAALAPYSGVVPINAMYLEHWLYVPLIGPVILIAGFYDRLTPTSRARVATLALLVLLVLMARTVVRNYEWADPERFYLAEMRSVGPSAQMLNNLALHLIGVGKTDRAIEALTLIIENSDTAPEPHDNLAQIYAKRGDYARARAEFLRALEIDPHNRNVMIGLRNLYDARGEYEQATALDQEIRRLARDRGL
jgi:tetratricopeptide (TPR) repeat protein